VSAPDWIKPLLGWKDASTATAMLCTDLFGEPLAPNISDMHNTGSMLFSEHVYRALDIPLTRRRADASESDGAKKSSSGRALERAIERHLGEELRTLDSDRLWTVKSTGPVSQFVQYTHLTTMQELFDQNPTLRASLARDYQVETDVYVGVQAKAEPQRSPFLHAAISSKFTIRSDRVQNVRHEFNTLVRNRRGRTPHLILVTAEPQPSRLTSITRGTGELDAVYHVLFDELDPAVREVCKQRPSLHKQLRDWNEMVDQKRLRPYSQLANDLVTT
jgi:hypothetical protein